MERSLIAPAAKPSAARGRIVKGEDAQPVVHSEALVKNPYVDVR